MVVKKLNKANVVRSDTQKASSEAATGNMINSIAKFIASLYQPKYKVKKLSYDLHKPYSKNEKITLINKYFNWMSIKKKFKEAKTEYENAKSQLGSHAIGAILIGLIIIIIGIFLKSISATIGGIVLGSILIVIGFLMYKAREFLEGPPSFVDVPDQLIDKFLIEEIEDKEKEAVINLGFEREKSVRNPIRIFAPDLERYTLNWKVGNDGKVRFTHYVLLSLRFYQKELVVLRATLNFLELEWDYEDSTALFLQDITMATLTTKPADKDKVYTFGDIKIKFNKIEKFTLNAMGTRFEIVLSSPEFERKIKEKEGKKDIIIYNKSEALQAARTITQLAREKKR